MQTLLILYLVFTLSDTTSSPLNWFIIFSSTKKPFVDILIETKKCQTPCFQQSPNTNNTFGIVIT